MAQSIQSRLDALGITLPAPAAPAANYVPFLLHQGQLIVSGQLPMGPDGLAQTGKLGGGVSLEQGQAAARLCAINILAQAQAALGDLERIVKVLRLNGFVNSAPDFTDQPAIINGASDLIADVLGERGRHTRIAVGCAALPFDASVEVDAILAVSG